MKDNILAQIGSTWFQMYHNNIFHMSCPIIMLITEISIIKTITTLADTLTHLMIIRKFEADANFEQDGARLGRDGQR